MGSRRPLMVHCTVKVPTAVGGSGEGGGAAPDSCNASAASQNMAFQAFIRISSVLGVRGVAVTGRSRALYSAGSMPALPPLRVLLALCSVECLGARPLLRHARRKRTRSRGGLHIKPPQIR